MKTKYILETVVELRGDPNFEFSMPFRQFVVALLELADIPLVSRYNIPRCT